MKDFILEDIFGTLLNITTCSDSIAFLWTPSFPLSKRRNLKLSNSSFIPMREKRDLLLQFPNFKCTNPFYSNDGLSFPKELIDIHGEDSLLSQWLIQFFF